jgi:hypothetical protein
VGWRGPRVKRPTLAHCQRHNLLEHQPELGQLRKLAVSNNYGTPTPGDPSLDYGCQKPSFERYLGSRVGGVKLGSGRGIMVRNPALFGR